eukprot:4440887-Amphidinium_carterae.3
MGGDVTMRAAQPNKLDSDELEHLWRRLAGDRGPSCGGAHCGRTLYASKKRLRHLAYGTLRAGLLM